MAGGRAGTVQKNGTPYQVGCPIAVSRKFRRSREAAGRYFAGRS